MLLWIFYCKCIYSRIQNTDYYYIWKETCFCFCLTCCLKYFIAPSAFCAYTCMHITCALTSSVLYMPIPQPPPGKSYTSHSLVLLPSAGEKTILNVPGWLTTKSVALYCKVTRGQCVSENKYIKKKTASLSKKHTWSPWACLPMVMACVQPGTSLGMFLQMIGSRKTVPPRMFLIVPLGLFHIFFRLNSVKLMTLIYILIFLPVSMLVKTWI